MDHRRSLIIVCLSTVFVATCAVATPPGAPTPTPAGSPSPTESDTRSTSSVPASGVTPATDGPPPSVTAAPSRPAPTTGGPSPAPTGTPTAATPPEAELHGPFEPVTGLVGRRCAGGECHGSAPPPRDRLPRAAVGLAGSGLSIELPLGTVITSWQVDAERVPMGRPNGFEPVLLGTGGEEPHAALYLPAPAQGDWIMRATVHSTAEDLTDYHWAVRVREPGRPPAPGVGPPDGTLRGGQAFATAYEGSYCLGETCSDIGHLPTARISPLLRTGTADRELLFDLEGRSGFTTWEVTFWDARDDQGTDVTHLAEGGRAGITTRRTDFATPPSGDWQVRIRVGFPEAGDATYYVHVIVP